MTLRQADPSRTAGIQRLYGAELVRRLAQLNEAIRTSIIDNDALGLTDGFLILHAVTPAPPKAWASVSEVETQRRFAQWLGTAMEQMLELDPSGQVPAWLKAFVRASYTKGITTAMQMIEKARPEIRRAVEQIMSTPFHRERLEGLFQRNLTELKGITSTMQTKIQRALADGLLQGENPRAIARRISKEVGISLKRARVIARTETVRTAAEAQLNTFERFGIASVSVDAEYLTAGDDRVCPICQALSGKIMSIEKARGIIPQHPNCRCGWIPVVKRQEQTA